MHVSTVDLMDIFLFLITSAKKENVSVKEKKNILVLKMITTRIGAREVVKNTIGSLMKQLWGTK